MRRRPRTSVPPRTSASPPAARSTQRNGTREKVVTTTAGDVTVKIPKTRIGSFFPWLLSPRRRIDVALQAVVMQAYVEGVSTRRVDDLVVAMGGTGISRSEVSRICAQLDKDVAAWRGRPLNEIAFPYVFLDATSCKVRVNKRVVSQAVVIATGVSADGRREVLGCAVGDSETEAFWTEFLRSLRDRGLAGVHLVISDSHRGLTNAVAAVLHGASWESAGCTSSATPSPRSTRDMRRWSPRPSARSSPSRPPTPSASRSTRSPTLSPVASRPSPTCSARPRQT
jgi:transposase-like protein